RPAIFIHKHDSRKVDATLAASVIHSSEIGIRDLERSLDNNNINVRL
ncbi:hypothetical protein EVA_14870, partial [gut metagenome]